MARGSLARLLDRAFRRDPGSRRGRRRSRSRSAAPLGSPWLPPPMRVRTQDRTARSLDSPGRRPDRPAWSGAARSRPEIDVAVDRVAVDRSKFFGGEVELVQRGDVLLQLFGAAGADER